ncbi:TonB-dependent receptor [Catenovulum agarivorans DS-2]|uniref:TonB-dependent receptor n=1 Tax=Catenovulum agarivorans DS-2 TaxID=1328313 RepID=W7Q8T5_9ALTE|nr:TonB-dependent receptor [Catenovulum agarivorans]EWH09234.1 TonB-dependent receptor [Catenovulum agarivorans DS-2]
MLKNKITKFKLKPLTLAVTAASLVQTSIAVAQEKTSEPEVINVTGVRTSLVAATANKRFSNQIVDSIVADDIGKLPDNTIAESLGRVAGVQVDQGIGEGSSISIRGLRENVTLYNGRTIIDVNGRGGTGMDTLNTSTYSIMSMVPSALTKQLDVTKLASADMIDGAVGGVVNIMSRKPFDKMGEQKAISYAANYNDQNKDLGHQLFGMYSNTFNQDSFGILVSANIDMREVSQDGIGTFNGWTALPEDRSVTSAGGERLDLDSQGNEVKILLNGDPRFQQIIDDRDRVSGSVLAQWRPSDELELTADVLYSRFDSVRDRHWLSTPLAGDFTNAELDENNFLMAGSASRPLQNNAEYVDLTTDLLSGAVNADWSLSEQINVFAELSFSQSDSNRKQIFNRVQTLDTFDIDFDVRRGKFGGDFNFDGDPLDKSGYRWNNYFDNRTKAETTHLSQKIDLDIFLNNDIFTKFEAGVRLQQYDTKSVAGNRQLVPFRNQPDDNLLDYEQKFGMEGAFEIFSNQDYLAGELAGLPRTYLIGQGRNIAGCESVIEVFNAADKEKCLNPQSDINNLLSTWTVKEDHLALYAKLNYELYLGDMFAYGNFGVRYLTRDLQSTGYQAASSDEVVQQTAKVDNNELLPSAMFNLDITDDLKLRIGGAKVLAYPSTVSMRNAFRLFVPTDTDEDGNLIAGFGNGGSPELKPFIATQYDLALEWYFNKSSAVSATVFTKDIESFVIPRQNQLTFDTYPDVPYFVVSQDANGEGGTIKGIEFFYQQAFDFLPEPFDGFGVTASYAIIDSETNLKDLAGNPQPFLGLSEKSGNLIAYYEKGDHSIRMAYNFRDPYLQSIGSEDLGWYADEYKQLAMTYRYNISDDISVSLQGNNLTEENNKTYAQYPVAVLTNTERGRTLRASITANW